MNTNQFSLANRKQLADMLKDKPDGLRHRAKTRFAAKVEALKTSLVKEYAEKKGASSIVKQLEAGRAKVEELETALQALGFELSCGELRLYDRYSNPLDDLIDARVERELGSCADIDARFDSAQIAMMTVATLEDADKLLKSVSAI